MDGKGEEGGAGGGGVGVGKFHFNDLTHLTNV